MDQKPSDRDEAGIAAGPPPPNAAQLRDDIATGRTRDKVAHSDPAAAPLGTDDEAAGTPPTGEQAAMARRQEAGRRAAESSG